MDKKQLTVEEAMQRKVSLHVIKYRNACHIIASDNYLGERTLEMAVAEIANLSPEDDNFPDVLEYYMGCVSDIARDVPVSSLDLWSADDWTDPEEHFMYIKIG